MSENRIQVLDDPDEKPEGEETDEDILAEARARYRLCADNESENYQAARDDLLFLSGGDNQWEPASAQLRRAEGRPCLTVNNMPTFLHKVTNEQRQNTPSVKVQPVGDGANKETAEVLQGLIRHIQYQSSADIAYDTAVNNAAAIGIGWFRLVTDYESQDSFDQCIKVRRVRNPLSVHIDPMSTELDGSDMSYGFIDCIESRGEFKRLYPDAEANNTNLIGQQAYSGWVTDKSVLITEYYRIKKTEATLCQLQNGESGWKDELPPGAEQYIVKERQSTRQSVQWFKLTGMDVLDRTEIKCKWIPLFPVYGDEIDIDGRVVRSGIIRNAKDPFKMYNLWITLATEEVAMRPKTPYIGAVGQFDTSKKQWATANNRSYAYIEYDPVTVDGTLAPAPQRQPMADVPSGMLAMAMHAADNKKSTTGLFDASLGARGTASSGIQEREQQQQGEISNYHYADNLNKAVCHAGRCMIDMIPHYYDAPRTVRIMGEDESSKAVVINQEYEKKGKMGGVERALHDVTAGRYDVTVVAGPSYTSKRQEAAEFLTATLQAAKDPMTSNVVTYLALSNQDVPGADKAARMLETLLPPGAKAVVDEDKDDDGEQMIQTPKGPLPISQAPEAIAGMEHHIQQLEQVMEQHQAEMQRVQMEKVQIEAKKSEISVAERLLNADQEVAKAQGQAEYEKIRAEFDAREAQLEKMKMEIQSAQDALVSQQKLMKADFDLATEKLNNSNMTGAPLPNSPSHPQQKQEKSDADKASAQTQMMIARALQAVADAQSKKNLNLQIAAPSGAVYNVKVN